MFLSLKFPMFNIQFQWYQASNRSRDSVVGIATSYGLDGCGSIPGGSKKFFFTSIALRPALVPTQTHILWVPGALSPGVKRPGREVDHSPPTSAKVKKMWIYTSSPIRLHGIVLN
jgi:hypothetical protein